MKNKNSKPPTDEGRPSPFNHHRAVDSSVEGRRRPQPAPGNEGPLAPERGSKTREPTPRGAYWASPGARVPRRRRRVPDRRGARGGAALLQTFARGRPSEAPPPGIASHLVAADGAMLALARLAGRALGTAGAHRNAARTRARTPSRTASASIRARCASNDPDDPRGPPSRPGPPSSSSNPRSSPSPSSPARRDDDDDDAAALTVAQLKSLLRSRGERVGGRKADLVARVLATGGAATPGTPGTPGERTPTDPAGGSPSRGRARRPRPRRRARPRRRPRPRLPATPGERSFRSLSPPPRGCAGW